MSPASEYLMKKFEDGTLDRAHVLFFCRALDENIHTINTWEENPLSSFDRKELLEEIDRRMKS